MTGAGSEMPPRIPLQPDLRRHGGRKMAHRAGSLPPLPVRKLPEPPERLGLRAGWRRLVSGARLAQTPPADR